MFSSESKKTSFLIHPSIRAYITADSPVPTSTSCSTPLRLVRPAVVNGASKPSAKPQSHPSAARRKRWSELNKIIAEKVSKKAKKSNNDYSSGSSSMAYSPITWNDIEGVYDPLLKALKLEAEPIADAFFDLVHLYLQLAHKCFGPLVTGKEAQRLHLIAAILVAVCNHFNGDVKILVEESMDGIDIQVKGRFEFILQRNNVRVCVVEAKRDDMAQGLAQDLLGCEPVANKEGLSVAYGIVTNYMEWILVKKQDDGILLHETTLEIDNGVAVREAVAKMCGLICALLSEKQ
ncbi:hypothetical protein SeLEV6574_g00438 [Synchytrium endobioticum]|nr:hypothetical protein SeLEV6574_g00438 [Synchytrium endobioticum]